MANKFDIDSSADTHLLNETFHVFSKSPGSPTTTLGGARLKSGHTTTATDVWADEIPAFFNAATQAKFDLFQSKAVKDDLCLFDGKVYQHNGTAFVSLGTTDEVLVDGKTFSKNNKAVVKYHKGRTAINLTADNNNGDGSNDYTAKIYNAATGSTTFVPQFISAMDKMVDGIPSLAYDAVVSDGTGVLAEGLTADNDYICNSYAGVIQFNRTRSQGTVTVSAWEYIGEKLTSSLTELAKKVESVTATAGEGVQAVTDAATTAGLSVSTKEIAVEGETVTVKALDIDVAEVSAQGVVTTGDETKLVTATGAHNVAKKAASDAITAAVADGSVIDTRIDEVITTATLADGQKIADTADTSKLVTVEDVKTYVSENAKVTLTADTTTGKTGITISPNGQESTSFTIGVDQTIIATKQSVDDLSDVVSGVSQTITDIQTSLSTGSIATAIQAAQAAADAAMEEAQTKVASVTGPESGLVTVTGDKDVTITVSDTIATKDYASTAASTAVNGLKETAITSQSVLGAGVSVTLGGKVGAPILTGSVTPATYTSSTKQWENDSYFATASDIATAISDAVNNITIPTLSTSSTGVGLSASGHTVDITTANYTPASGDTAASWTYPNYLVTGATVEAFVGAETAKTLEEAKAYSNSLHTTSVTYHVTDTLPTVPSGKEEEYKGRIYLVLTGLDNKVAADGARIEYMYINKGTEDSPQWGWEQIGTTTADLTGYAKSVTINGTTYPANATNAGALNLGKVASTVSESNHTGWSGDDSSYLVSSPIYTHIASDGTLKQAIYVANSGSYGVGKIFSGEYYSLPSNVTDTAVSTLTASAMFSNLNDILATKADVNNVVNSINGKRGDVTLCVHNYKAADTNEEGDSLPVASPSKHANLWGMTFIEDDSISKVILVDDFVGMSSSYLTTANLPSNAVSVENNFVYAVSGDVITTIRPERMVSGFNAQNAKGLTSFVGDLSNLETSDLYLDGSSTATFYHCLALETFIGDLSSLKDGNSMFSSCNSLTTFIGDLSSLETGSVGLYTGTSGMFQYTALTVESVETIADTLPENPVVDTTSGNGSFKGCITISWHQLTSDTAERQKLVDALSGVLDKGWVLVTNTELLTMFDTEKYQVVQETVQPLDLDSEPQEIAYVIKK